MNVVSEISKGKGQKPERIETGRVDVEEFANLALESDILAIHWSKINVSHSSFIFASIDNVL